MTRARDARQPGAPWEGRPAARVRARISWHEYLCGALVSTSIVALDGRVEAEVSDLPAERLIAGTPELQVRNFFTDTSQQFFAGRWSASRGKWRVRYTEHEFCVIIEGRVRIESVTGEKHELRAGDAFVVPAGFEGIWEVTEPCKKWYSIFEPKGS